MHNLINGAKTKQRDRFLFLLIIFGKKNGKKCIQKRKERERRKSIETDISAFILLTFRTCCAIIKAQLVQLSPGHSVSWKEMVNYWKNTNKFHLPVSFHSFYCFACLAQHTIKRDILFVEQKANLKTNTYIIYVITSTIIMIIMYNGMRGRQADRERRYV